MPTPVGRAMDRAVHLMLLVSLAMVRQVVEQGQWARENSMVHTAVSHVQPWSASRVFSAARFSYSTRLPVER